MATISDLSNPPSTTPQSSSDSSIAAGIGGGIAAGLIVLIVIVVTVIAVVVFILKMRQKKSKSEDLRNDESGHKGLDNPVYSGISELHSYSYYILWLLTVL